MTVLLLTSYEVKCKKSGEHLLIEKTTYDEDQTPRTTRVNQPIKHLTGVIVEGHVYVAPSAHLLLMSHSIPVVWMKGHELVGVSHAFAGTGTVITRRAQFLAFHEWQGANIARGFVMGGMANKANLLLSYAKNRTGQDMERLKTAATEVREVLAHVQKLRTPEGVDSFRNLLMAYEARGTKIYLEALRTLYPEEYGFEKRTRRPPTDPINAALSYGYAVIHAKCLLAVIGAGLDPYGGFLHVDRSGRTSLALDLAEEFRQPVVDRTVTTMAVRKQLDPEHDFDREGSMCLLNSRGKNKLITGLEERLETYVNDPAGRIKTRGMMLRQARRVVHYLLGKSKEYTPYVAGW